MKKSKLLDFARIVFSIGVFSATAEVWRFFMNSPVYYANYFIYIPSIYPLGSLILAFSYLLLVFIRYYRLFLPFLIVIFSFFTGYPLLAVFSIPMALALFKDIFEVEAFLKGLLLIVVPSFLLAYIVASFHLPIFTAFNVFPAFVSVFLLLFFYRIAPYALLLLFILSLAGFKRSTDFLKSGVDYKQLLMVSMVLLVFSLPLSYYIIEGGSGSVDVQYYVSWLSELNSYEDLWGKLCYLASRERSVFIVSLYVYSLLLGDIFLAAKSFYLILLPVFSFSAGVLASLWGGKRLQLLAVLLSFLSYMLTVGVYAGYFSNLMALIFLNLMLFYYYKRGFAKALPMSILAYFTHPYSWSEYLGVFSMYHLASREFKKIPKVLALGAIPVILDFFIKFIVKAVAGFQMAFRSGAGNLALSNAMVFWSNYMKAFYLWYGGLLALGIVFLLAGVGVITKGPRFLLFWLVVIGFMFPFANAMLQTRLLFNFPMYILEALGLLALAEKLGEEDGRLFILFVVFFHMFYSVVGLALIKPG